MINALSDYFQVIHVGNEDDVDVIIVQSALELSALKDNVRLVCDDTDGLIMLLNHHLNCPR